MAIQAMTPLKPGTYIALDQDNPGDDQSLTAFLCNSEDETEVELGWVTPSSDPAQFEWLVRSAAAIHNLEVVDMRRENV